MKAQPHHDSAAFLEVVRVRARPPYRFGAGWYVRRTCACHQRENVSIRFETRAEAEHCRDVLDDDSRRSYGGVPNVGRKSHIRQCRSPATALVEGAAAGSPRPVWTGPPLAEAESQLKGLC